MSIKTFGITVVAFLLLAALISILTPKGKLENTIKFVISLSFIYVIITAIGGTKFDFKISIPNDINVNVTNDIYNQSLDMTKQILADKIKLELTSQGIELQYLQINADILDDKSIIIDSVNYICNENPNEAFIEKTIINITGCKNVERITNEGNTVK